MKSSSTRSEIILTTALLILLSSVCPVVVIDGERSAVSLSNVFKNVNETVGVQLPRRGEDGIAM